jgi:hypothetical protein
VSFKRSGKAIKILFFFPVAECPKLASVELIK